MLCCIDWSVCPYIIHASFEISNSFHRHHRCCTEVETANIECFESCMTLFYVERSNTLFFKLSNLQESFYSLTDQNTTFYTFVTNSESGELSVANRCIVFFVFARKYVTGDVNCSSILTGDQIVIQTVQTQGYLNFYEVKVYRKLLFMKLTTNTIMYNINIKYDPQRRRK